MTQPSDPAYPPPPSGAPSADDASAAGPSPLVPPNGEYARTLPSPAVPVAAVPVTAADAYGLPSATAYSDPPAGSGGQQTPPGGHDHQPAPSTASHGFQQEASAGGHGHQPAPSTASHGFQQGPPTADNGFAAPPGAAYGFGQPSAGTISASTVPAGMFYDPDSGLTLPLGTQLASPGRRIGAAFLAIPLSIVTLGIGYIIWGAIIWGSGQTPALQVLGMRCWRPDTGQVAGWWWMALREIVGRFVDGVLSIITLLISFIFMLVNKDRKTLHDLIAGTVVLYDPDKLLKS